MSQLQGPQKPCPRGHKRTGQPEPGFKFLDLGYLDMLLACGGIFEAATLLSGVQPARFCVGNNFQEVTDVFSLKSTGSSVSISPGPHTHARTRTHEHTLCQPVVHQEALRLAFTHTLHARMPVPPRTHARAHTHTCARAHILCQPVVHWEELSVSPLSTARARTHTHTPAPSAIFVLIVIGH